MKTGIFVIESMPIAYPAEPGLSEPEKWRPYKLWSADGWQCLGCGHELIVGWGQRHITEHYEKDFETKVESFKPEFTINDC